MKISNEEFGRLYQAYYREVYYVALKLTRDEQNAMDITQEAFTKAFIRMEDIKDSDSFKPYVKAVARNGALNYLKRANLIKFESADEENFVEVSDERKGPEDEAVDNDVQDVLMKLIEKLPTEQSIALFLFYYENMSVKEIADACNCPEKTIYSRLSYAKKNLKAEVEKTEDEEVKLRCIAALPFLYIIFKSEAQKAYAATLVPSVFSPSVSSVSAEGSKGINLGGRIMSAKLIKIIIGIVAATAITAGVIGAIASSSNKDSKKDNSNKSKIESEVDSTSTEKDATGNLVDNNTVTDNGLANNTSANNTDGYLETEFVAKPIFKFDKDGNIVNALVVIENTSDKDVKFEVYSKANEGKSTFSKVRTYAKAGDTVCAYFRYTTDVQTDTFTVKAKEYKNVIGLDRFNVEIDGNGSFISEKINSVGEAFKGDNIESYMVLYDKDNNVVEIVNYTILDEINDEGGSVDCYFAEYDHYEQYMNPSYYTDYAPTESNTSVDIYYTNTKSNGELKVFINATNNEDFICDINYDITVFDKNNKIIGHMGDCAKQILPKTTTMVYTSVLINNTDIGSIKLRKKSDFKVENHIYKEYSQNQIGITVDEISENTYAVLLDNNTGDTVNVEFIAKVVDANGSIVNMFYENLYPLDPGEKGNRNLVYQNLNFKESGEIDMSRCDHIENILRVRAEEYDK